MFTHTVITVVFAIATFTKITNGIQEESEQEIYFNEEPLQDHVFLQNRHYDETPPFLLPCSTIVQRTTKNIKDTGNDQQIPMTLLTMNNHHFLKLFPILKAEKKITLVKPTRSQPPGHHQYQVKRSNMDFEKYPNLPFSTLVRQGKDMK